MAKAYILIKDKVQEVGYRAFVMERFLETNLKGGAVNTPDGNVMVLMQGRREDIIAFVERLKRERPELAENPVLVGPNFDESLQIPDEVRLSHALEMNQFGKAVVYLAGIDKKMDDLQGGNKRLVEKIDGLREEIGKKLDELPKKISKELGQKFDELPDKIVDKLGPKLDALPKKFAEALKGNTTIQ